MRIFLCVIAAAMLFSSCATIISGSTKVFGIDSEPKAAKVEITDRNGKVVFRGETPVTTSLKSGAGYFRRAIYEIKVSMDGYETKVIPVQARLNGWYFANAFIGGALGWLIIDPLTGAMYRFSDSQASIDAQLVAKSTTSVQTLRVINLQDVPVDQRKSLVRLR